MFWARGAAETIKFVDDYCEWYRNLFPEVRSFEAFKYLHIGMISDIKRKTLPAFLACSKIKQRARTIAFLNRISLEFIRTERDEIKADITSISRKRNNHYY